MPHPLCYVFKRELLYIPFFGWAMARMDMIHIDRSKRAEAWAKVAEQGRALHGAGQLGDHVPRRHAHAARRPGHVQERRHAARGRDRRPVVPIAVTSARCWPRKSFVLRPGVDRRLDRQADRRRAAASPTS